MSGVFFQGLDLPAADVNLGVGSGSHGVQTAAMLTGMEAVLQAERPDWLLVYGDTNSTIAGALAASKLHVPVAHVEAGLRSFNRRMPEEVNRLLTDHVSSLLLCPSDRARRNLLAEGISARVHVVGDVMLDVLNWAKAQMERGAPVLHRAGVSPRGYLLATLHRGENTDDPRRLAEIIDAFNRIREPIVLPLHPRTRKALAAAQLSVETHVRVMDPVSYLEMIALADSARLILTDSGGLQKEAYWLGVPCLTLRDETEWVETVDAGWNTLVSADAGRIVAAVAQHAPPTVRPALYGDGAAAERCISILSSEWVACVHAGAAGATRP
jgi:UDP-N-acetylglucosamine 2-epimerase